ncbi:hypothetical protein [Riemerella columbina]|uniref:hypothetical protein n=1 Tax=Riemerella columbina TaxID=103810 RepID=UPI00036EAFF0|nr:hypothetical protein [Riemerella columbina]
MKSISVTEQLNKMNYATTTYHQGKFTPTKEEHETQRNIVPTTSGVFGLYQESQRPKRGTERQAKKRTHKPSANDILRNVFMPKMLETKGISINERDFFKSLSKLAEHYGFSPADTQNEPYPYNVHLAYHHAKKQLHQNEFYSNLRILKNEEESYLSIEETFCTNHSLYHIPIKPLYWMLRDKKTKPLAKLLLSVYAYFCRVGVPYYKNDDFLCYRYEILTEWIMFDEPYSDEECQEQKRNLQTLKECNTLGDLMYKKIKNSNNLDFFERRLNTFKVRNPFDLEYKQLAEKVYQLYKDYPNENIFRYSNYQPQEDEEYETITMDKYIGFVPTANDCISNQIVEMLNSEFNECIEIDQPTIYRKFSKNHKKDTRNFDFERRLFESISDTYHLFN